MLKGHIMEHVLVITRGLLDQIGSFQGFQPDAERYLQAMLAPGANHFMERPAAEIDPTHKQLIPYAVFHHAGLYLTYTRGGSSGEKRLVAKRSIGIGGHINPVDAAQDSLGETMYYNGVEREIAEELVLAGTHSQRVIGLINDDSTEVGSVHLGVVHLFDLSSDEVSSNEDAIQDLRFETLEDLHASRERLETWSQICIDHLWRGLGRA
jgi:predicted NUDIX family phosphoesterase